MSLATRVTGAIPGLVVSDTQVDRLAYARDLWPRHHLGVREQGALAASRPALVAWPTSTEQAAAVVRFCRAEGVPLVPFGAGSGVCGGVLPGEQAMVLDLKRMSAIRRLDAEQPSLTVEAGALGIRLEEEIQRKGFTIGHFPSSILCSTVGGWLAARGAGQNSGRYGKIEDMVAAIEMVDGRGEVLDLRRRTSGLDLTPLVIGSEGTLGVITSCTLRLHPDPTRRAFQSFTFPTVEAGWEALRRIFQAGLRPAVSRLYDPFDSFLAAQKKAHRSRGNPGDGYRPTLPFLRRPRFLNGLVDALGSRVFGGATLILIFEGNSDEPHDDASKAEALAASVGGRPLGEGPARKWLEHRYSVSYRQAPVFRAGAFGDTMEVAAPWSRLKALYDGVRHAMGQHVFVMAHLSHAYPDGCSIYFSFAGTEGGGRSSEQVYDATWQAALQAAIEAGGTLSHHHGVGRSKAPRLGAELGVGVDVIRGLMRAFDPGGLMNPGNLLPREESREVQLPRLSDAFSVDGDSLVATLPAPMPLREAASRLAQAGYGLPLAGECPELSVGAWFEAGAPGAADPWGDPCDHLVAGLRAELPSGARLALPPCPRRAVGPDLIPLFVGAEGRFGKLLAVDARVRRRGEPPARALPYSGPRCPELTGSERQMADHIAAALPR